MHPRSAHGRCADAHHGDQRERGRELLVTPLHPVVGDDREQPSLRSGPRDDEPERAASEADVGIDEDQQPPQREARPLPTGPGLTGPPLWNRLAVDDRHAGERLGDSTGAVGGAVVDHDHLRGPGGLSGQRLEQDRKRLLLVTCRYDTVQSRTAEASACSAS